MTDREVMQQALEALEADNSKLWPSDKRSIAIEALRARLAEPEPEPVAWRYKLPSGKLWHFTPHGTHEFSKRGLGMQPLYTAPPTRRPLTDEEIDALETDKDGLPNSHLEFARAIEAAHGIKETE